MVCLQARLPWLAILAILSAAQVIEFFPQFGGDCKDDAGMVCAMLARSDKSGCKEFMVPDICAKTCGKCVESGSVKEFCIDKSSICKLRQSHGSQNVLCRSFENQQICGKTCGDCADDIDAYVGCYKDNFGDRAMTRQEMEGNNPWMVRTCVDACQKRGQKYAGLQNGQDCYCGDNFDKYGIVSDSKCNRFCSGDTTFTCGGQLHNSVYTLSEGGCIDKINGCGQLKKEGKCETDALNMIQNCSRTCDACFTTTGNLGCYCHGDPHCYSFDNKKTSYQGKCKYTLARDECRNGVPINDSPRFNVTGDFTRWNNTEFTMVQAVNIWIRDQKMLVTLLEGGLVEIDGGPVKLPYSKDGMVVYSNRPYSRFVDLKLGIYIEHGESNYFSMRVRELYKSELCGLCGNYDDNPDDDWRTGPGCADAGPGLLTENYNWWGASWRTEDLDNDAGCKKVELCKELEMPPPDCQPLDRQEAKVACQTVETFLNSDAEAKRCLMNLPAGTYTEVLADCVFDFCSTKDKLSICQTLTAFSHKCWEHAGIVIEFRTDNRCPISCEENMIYYKKLCGVCELNCWGEKVDPFCVPNDLNTCYGGCYCLPGYRRNNGKCIFPDECQNAITCQLSFRDAELPINY
ncbi:kielin/chordin-like protein [Watersipora subatra]|uniref:kielin/chordin-like protein n=1 Tax=Watersipora subatra TaxID=2589382 RepID=UPI00355BFCB9